MQHTFKVTWRSEPKLNAVKICFVMVRFKHVQQPWTWTARVKTTAITQFKCLIRMREADQVILKFVCNKLSWSKPRVKSLIYTRYSNNFQINKNPIKSLASMGLLTYESANNTLHLNSSLRTEKRGVTQNLCNNRDNQFHEYLWFQRFLWTTVHGCKG